MMRTTHWRAHAGALLIAGAATSRAQAQDPAGDTSRDRVSERVMGARPTVERMAEAVKRRLGLNDEQARQLRDATARYATQRQQLMRQERTLRRELRDELARGTGAQQERVGRMLDDLLALQRSRADLVGAEQRDLARFMTPVQRAEFLALQERAFRAAQQMRQQREARAGEARPGEPGERSRSRRPDR
ncbi:MAG: hypothetical protein ACXW05_11865 [Gemmatirosa sp.]